MRQILTAAVLACAVVVTTGCAAEPAPVSDKLQKYYDENVKNARVISEASVMPVKFAAFGDSITEANSPDFAKERVGDGSWVYHAQSEKLAFAGGWADGGATTPRMVQEAEPVEADVVVILAGTNDLGRRPIAESAANIQNIAETSGAARVIVSAVPPLDKAPELAVQYNAEMKAFVQGKGWTWVDPMGPIRDGDVYAEGMTLDGTHPTPKAARFIGQGISRAITS